MKRVQWKRQWAKPLPPNTKLVTRNSRWGNPYKLKDYDRASSLRLFKQYARDQLKRYPLWLEPLRDHDLACNCDPNDPCHADILLQLIAQLPPQTITIQP